MVERYGFPDDLRQRWEIEQRQVLSTPIWAGIVDLLQWFYRHSDDLFQNIQGSSSSAMLSFINTLRWCVRNDSCLEALNACQVAMQDLVDEWTVSSSLIIEGTLLTVLRAEP
jgi:hypothetical protein